MTGVETVAAVVVGVVARSTAAFAVGRRFTRRWIHDRRLISLNFSTISLHLNDKKSFLLF